ncbi:MAG TPA: hypothetical protein DCR35_12250 [Runella sp.]|nr:hypothetical protein [Runella sp.]
MTKTRPLLFFLFLMSTLSSLGQGSKPNALDNRSFTDSATHVLIEKLNKYLLLPGSPKKDSLVYITHRFISRNYMFNNNCDEMLKYGELHKKYAEAQKNKTELLIALVSIRSSYQNRLNKNPLKIHSIALEQLRLLDSEFPQDTRLGFYCYTVIGYFVNFYVQREEYDLAKQFLQKHKGLLHQQNYTSLYNQVNKQKPDPRTEINRYLVMLQEYKAEKIKKDPSDSWMPLAFTADKYNELNLPDSAIYFANLAFETSKLPNGNPFPTQPTGPEESYNETLARAYFLKKDYSKALFYVQKLPPNYDDYRLLYDVYKSVGKSSEALSNYESLMKERLKRDSLNRLKSVQAMQIGFETDKVRLEEKQHGDSLLNLKQLELLKVVNRQQLLEKESILKTLSLNQLQKKSLKQLLENQSIKLQADQQESEIKKFKINELNQQVDNQHRTRNFLSAGMMLMLFSGVSLLWYNRKLRLKNKDLEDKNEIIKEVTHKIQATEITALRAQMNPHFIFNCLNSIQLYTAQNNTEKATDYLNKFSRLIRLVLENSRSEKVSLENELETLRLYMEMEAMRFRGKVNAFINIAQNVDKDSIQIPPLLLQPFVENAIWHGLMHKEEGGIIRIEVTQPKENLLRFDITDDGVGREKAAEFKSKSATQNKSFGMKVTAERIELINQLYNTATQVQIIDLKNKQGEATGTKVVVEIPI